MKQALLAALLACLAAQPAQGFGAMEEARAHFAARRFAEAEALLAPLARAGNAEAEALLGDLYGFGFLERAPERAVEFWRRAALKGHPAAQLRLGRALASGTGAPRDPVRAALWLTLAGKGGAPLAEGEAEAALQALDERQRRQLDVLLSDLAPYLYPLDD